MAPKLSGEKLGEGGCKAAGEARRSAAHAEQPADGQPVDCSADAATKATQETNIKSAQKCDPELTGGGKKQEHEAGRDGNRAERQANRAAQNAASHHGTTSAASSKLHARVVKAVGQSAQSAGTVKAGASAGSTTQERQAGDKAETLHETLDMMQQMIKQQMIQ